jgi:predicted kinase
LRTPGRKARARAFCARPGTTVHLICGEQGAGKTTLALRLARELSAVRFSLDEWIVQLFGKTMPTPMNSVWWVEHAKLCSTVIWTTARQLLAAGTDVILDFGFASRAHRSESLDRAWEAGAEAKIHVVTADRDVRRAAARVFGPRPPREKLPSSSATLPLFSLPDRCIEVAISPVTTDRTGTILLWASLLARPRGLPDKEQEIHRPRRVVSGSPATIADRDLSLPKLAE